MQQQIGCSISTKSDNETIFCGTASPCKFGGGDTEGYSDKWGGRAPFQINSVLGGLRFAGF